MSPDLYWAGLFARLLPLLALSRRTVYHEYTTLNGASSHTLAITRPKFVLFKFQLQFQHASELAEPSIARCVYNKAAVVCLCLRH